MSAPNQNLSVRQGAIKNVALRAVLTATGQPDPQGLSVSARRGPSTLSDPAPTGFLTLTRATDPAQGWNLRIDARNVGVGDYFYRVVRADGTFLLAGVIDVGSGYATDVSGTSQSSRGDGAVGPTAQPGQPPQPTGPVFTEQDEHKLDNIEARATADQTPEEIRDGLQGLSGSDRLDASAVKNLPSGGGGGGGGLDQSAVDGRVTTLRPNAFTNTNVAQLAAAVMKLAGIEDNAKDDQTGQEIARLLENLSGNDRLSYTSLRNRQTGPQVAQQIRNLTGNDRDNLMAFIRDRIEAFSGGARFDYNSLRNTPQALTGADIVTLLMALSGNARLDASAIRNLPSGGGGGLTIAQIVTGLQGLQGTARLDYSAIEGGPPVGAEQNVQSDWNAASGDAAILNKPALAPSNAEQNVQADWNATSGDAFIRNKPTIPTLRTAAQTRDLLSGLSGNSRLQYSAIRGGPPSDATDDQTGAEIVTLLSALSGNARLPASAVRNLPTGGGGGLTIAQIVTGLEALTGDDRLNYSAIDDAPTELYAEMVSAQTLPSTARTHTITGHNLGVTGTDCMAVYVAFGATRVFPFMVMDGTAVRVSVTGHGTIDAFTINSNMTANSITVAASSSDNRNFFANTTIAFWTLQ